MKELESWFEALSKVGALPEGGYYRGSYTSEEVEIQRLLSGWMEKSGLSVNRDAAGNLWGKADCVCDRSFVGVK